MKKANTFGVLLSVALMLVLSVPSSTNAQTYLPSTITSQPNGSSVNYDTPTTFTWEALPYAQQYWLGIGTTPESIATNPWGDIYAASTGLNTSYSIDFSKEFPQGAVDTVYVRVWTLIGGVWEHNDYEFAVNPPEDEPRADTTGILIVKNQSDEGIGLSAPALVVSGLRIDYNHGAVSLVFDATAVGADISVPLGNDVRGIAHAEPSITSQILSDIGSATKATAIKIDYDITAFDEHKGFFFLEEGKTYTMEARIGSYNRAQSGEYHVHFDSIGLR